MVCLEDVVRKMIAANPDKVAQTKTRPATMVNWWVGRVMKETDGAFSSAAVRLTVYEELFTR